MWIHTKLNNYSMPQCLVFSIDNETVCWNHFPQFMWKRSTIVNPKYLFCYVKVADWSTLGKQQLTQLKMNSLCVSF